MLTEVSQLGALKPCPFCGSKSNGDRGADKGPKLIDEMPFPARVECMNCGARGPEGNEREAIIGWNSRPHGRE